MRILKGIKSEDLSKADFGETSLPNILNRTISIKESSIYGRRSEMRKEGLS
jgi:hypothetical protein